MNLLGIIPLWASLTAGALALVGVYLMMSNRVVRTAVDPAVPALFQLIFTFFVLLLIGVLPVSDAIGFLVFVGILLRFPPPRNPGKSFVTQADWVSFSKLFAVVLLITNLYLITQKGLLFMSDDITAARQDFFKGWGVFARINEIGIGLLVVTAAILWERGRKWTAAFAALLTGYVAMTLGSRSGLLLCLFAYGAYLHFAKRRISNKSLFVTGGVLATTSLGIFYLMFGPQFLAAFAYRVLAFSDGPVYFFYDKMYNFTSFSLEAPFDILLVNLRLRAVPMNVPLGPFIFLNHFNVFILQAPNPQMFVEAHAYLHEFGILWYVLAATLFVWLRGLATNPYTLYFATFIVAPFCVDSSYAISLLLTMALLFGSLVLFLSARWVLKDLTSNLMNGQLRAPMDQLQPSSQLSAASVDQTEEER